ncbi:MAG TPA: WYL domain-containing protein [Acidimicrobiales bacterium]|nr:WYL domain-containing protein [Acidimicrobiales bacterium]
MVDRLERLTDLVLVLLRDQRPKSLREIASEVPGYPAQEGEARRQAFERDKRTLRDGGIEVTATAIDGPEQVGYVIRPEDYYLPDLDLAPEEQAALNLAVAGVHLGDPSGRDALWRLGLPASAGARPVAELPALPALPVLHGALRARATVRFDYRGERRRVDPALLRFHGGWWYLVGYDLDRAAPRTFRVDRMEGDVSALDPSSAALPDGFDPDAALPDVPWRIGEGAPVTVVIRVDATLAGPVLDEVGEGALAGRDDDGSVTVHLEVTNTAALRSWLFELGEHAEVVGPEEVRAGVVAWLEAMAGTTTVPEAR